jgi:hypothetical protein
VATVVNMTVAYVHTTYLHDMTAFCLSKEHCSDSSKHIVLTSHVCLSFKVLLLVAYQVLHIILSSYQSLRSIESIVEQGLHHQKLSIDGAAYPLRAYVTVHDCSDPQTSVLECDEVVVVDDVNYCQ